MHQKINTKLIPEGWGKGVIGELCTSIVSGRTKPKIFDGAIPWVTAADLQGRYLPSRAQKNKISVAHIKAINGKLIPEGSVVITVIGNVGRVAIAKEEIVLNQQLHAFVCSEYIQNEYLAYWLETQKGHINRFASKTTVPYLNAINCQNIAVHYPPLAEQNKITEILLVWDNVIAVTEQLLNNCKQQKKAFIQQLLTGKKRLSGFTEPWQVHALADWIVEYKERTFVEEHHVVFTSSRKGLFPQEEYFRRKRRMQRNSAAFNVIPSGYITYRSRSDNSCFTFNINNTGKAVIVSMYYPVFNVPKGVNKFFVELLMLKEKILAAYSTGTSQKVLSINALKKIKVRIPCKAEQQAITAILATADNEIEHFQQRVNCLRQGRKILMRQLLCGKIQVNI